MQSDDHEAMAGIDNTRYGGIYTVLVYNIGRFYPFNHGSTEEERTLLHRMNQSRFREVKLYPELVKHYVIELYNYVHSTLSSKLQSAKVGRKLKVFSANLDVWKSLVSGEKYIGKHLPARTIFTVPQRLCVYVYLVFSCPILPIHSRSSSLLD
jgi:hypothetical protein